PPPPVSERGATLSDGGARRRGSVGLALPASFSLLFPPAGDLRPGRSLPRRRPAALLRRTEAIRHRERSRLPAGRALRPAAPTLDLRDPRARSEAGADPQAVVGARQRDFHAGRQLLPAVRPRPRGALAPTLPGGDVLDRLRPLRTVGGRRRQEAAAV